MRGGQCGKDSDRPRRDHGRRGHADFRHQDKAQAVRLAMEDAVKRHLRQEGFDAMDAGDFDFSEIIESTGPRNADGTLKREGGRAA